MTAHVQRRSHARLLSAIICVAWTLLGPTGPTSAAEALKSYNVDLSETSVSGISSGAFMAVQFGVAHSSIVKGVGATAGGPYFCASDDVPSLRGTIGNVIARCMQGDPAYPKRPITKTQMGAMAKATESWARAGRIDATSHLKRQRIWIFHGYNDGVVRYPVSDALYDYYTHFVDPSRIFYKDNLKAGHAQITDECGDRQGVCNLCQHTGGNFMNQCQQAGATNVPYDAAGSMLQHIYGTLAPRSSPSAPKGKIIPFSQSEFARDGTGAPLPIRIAMAEDGYVYVPDACGKEERCRVHIAFHGCLQSADKIGSAFYEHAGYNEWADNNHLIVLYPQTQATLLFGLPINPQGCWDWWGYNDSAFNPSGRYATKQGLQIAAIRRMLDRLSGQQSAVTPAGVSASPSGAVPAGFVVGDFTHRKVGLRWDPVAGASGYNVYRSTTAGGPYSDAQRVNTQPEAGTTLVDYKVNPTTKYFYVVRAVESGNKESPDSAEVSVVTAPIPPACDPFFSLQKNAAVTKNNKPTTETCP